MKQTAIALAGVLMLLALVSCKDPIQVQRDYVGDRDECRARSENQVGVYSAPGSIPASEKDRNTVLLQLFCECMKGHEWNVAGCPKPKEVAGKTSTPVAGQTSAPGAAAASQSSSKSGSTVVIIQAPATPPAPPTIIVPAPPPRDEQ